MILDRLPRQNRPTHRCRSLPQSTRPSSSSLEDRRRASLLLALRRTRTRNGPSHPRNREPTSARRVLRCPAGLLLSGGSTAVEQGTCRPRRAGDWCWASLRTGPLAHHRCWRPRVMSWQVVSCLPAFLHPRASRCLCQVPGSCHPGSFARCLELLAPPWASQYHCQVLGQFHPRSVALSRQHPSPCRHWWTRRYRPRLLILPAPLPWTNPSIRQLVHLPTTAHQVCRVHSQDRHRHHSA